MELVAVAPDERALRTALKTAGYQSGVDSGRWRLVSLEWPVGVFAVSAAEHPGSPSEYGLRIDLAGYPQQAPTATPWDLYLNAVLAPERRPNGTRVGHVFRTDWEEGQALYAPWDRVALQGHSNWSEQHPEHVWHPGRDISFFLKCVHELLNSDDYKGTQ